MDPLLTRSATSLAKDIATGKLSSRDVLEAHIARIEHVNPLLNAVVVPRFEAARAEADAADAAVREGRALGPLHGVPCTIKESFALEGMPWTSGFVPRKGVVAPSDAVSVSRLRAAGAIPMGVTNTSELCMWMESANRVYGRTGSAYDPRRTAGGSSGGEGSIVGAGGSPFGLGADVGGSIRIPAFFNGIFGHKPGAGVVPNSGQFPLTHGRALRMLATGPLCRRAEDLMPLLRILAGPDGEDEACVPTTLGDPDGVRVSGLTVLDVLGPTGGVSAELMEAQARVVAALTTRGATVRRTHFTGLAKAFDIWSATLAAAEGRSSFRKHLPRSRRRDVLGELMRWSAGRSDHTLPALVLAVGENINHRTPLRSARFVAAGEALRAEIAEAIGPNGVMLYPTHPRTAPRHGAALLRPLGWSLTAIFNALELPVTQVPLGLGRGGIPLGVQIVGAPGSDHVTIAVARALEEAFGGWVPPKLG